VTRADVIARIVSRVQFVTGAAPGDLPLDKPLADMGVDSLDRAEIEMEIEDEFGLAMATLDLKADCTIDSMAEAVMAAQPST
jgi:acyl carrier protein